MKVTVNENKKSGEITYPCLMKCTYADIIIFFYKEGCGAVLHTMDNTYKVGEYLQNRDMNKFTPFHGSVTLSND